MAAEDFSVPGELLGFLSVYVALAEASSASFRFSRRFSKCLSQLNFQRSLFYLLFS